MRKGSPLFISLTLAIVLMAINIALMSIWIILAARQSNWGALTVGTIAFSLVLIGISVYLFMMIKERQLNRRQINFIDSVTHELKSPIAALRLYLGTLQLRELDEAKRAEFYHTMDVELKRLDDMINQLLQVARLDAIGQDAERDDVDLRQLLVTLGRSAAARHGYAFEKIFRIEGDPVCLLAPKIMLDMIFGNLLDNAIKYGGRPPQVEIDWHRLTERRVEILIRDNGQGVPHEYRAKIFKLFFRAEEELERTTKGTGIGLYVTQTLVHKLKGRISVDARDDSSGSVFRVELPCQSSEARA